jgi:hypothetical protein
MALNLATWMTDTWSTLGSRALRDICLPGSHDAGMSSLTWHTLASTACNTQTQQTDVSGQLINGSRYFDIRPALPFDKSQEFYTGHFSGDSRFQLGATGESLTDVFAGVVQFLGQAGAENEVVILEFSHYRDFSTFAAFSDSQMQQFTEFVTTQLSSVLYTSPDDVLLPMVNLSQLAGKVVAVFDSLPSSLVSPSTGVFAGAQFGTTPLPDGNYNWTIYNNYSDTDDIWTMAAGQEKDFVGYDPALRAGSLYLVSWTMTMDFGDDVNPSPTDCISDHATAANDIMLTQLSSWGGAGGIARGKIPNVILSDWVGYPWAQGVVDLCVGLNAPSYVVAFQDTSDFLNVVDAYGQGGSTSEGMPPSTSPPAGPSIAALPSGGYVVAFQAGGGHLFTVTNTPWTVLDTGYPMVAGTSSSVAFVVVGGTGEAAVAFANADDGHLYVIGPGPSGRTLATLLPGASPSLAALPDGGYIVAFQATAETVSVLARIHRSGGSGSENWAERARSRCGGPIWGVLEGWRVR